MYVYIYIYIFISTIIHNIVIVVIMVVTRTRPGPSASPGSPPRNQSAAPHSCHILPFQPILRYKYFPPEPANTAKHSPKSISEGGRIWQVCTSLLRSVFVCCCTCLLFRCCSYRCHCLLLFKTGIYIHIFYIHTYICIYIYIYIYMRVYVHCEGGITLCINDGVADSLQRSCLAS